MEYLNYNKTYHENNITVTYLFFDERSSILKGNEKFKVIKYQELWFNFLLKLYRTLKDYKILIELYPAISSQLNLTVEEEIEELKEKFSKSKFYLRDNKSKPEKLIFDLSNIFDLEDLIYRYSESDQLTIYFVGEQFDLKEFIDKTNQENILNRKNTFVSLANGGVFLMFQFHPIAIELEVTLNSSNEGSFNLFLRGLKS